MLHHRLAASMVATLLFAAPACAQMPISSQVPAQQVPPRADSPATLEYKQSMAMMHRGMMIPYTNDADRDFAAGMVPHHQGAIDMAQTELRYGKDPEMRKLARSIIDGQTKEIAGMRAWLAHHPAQ